MLMRLIGVPPSYGVQNGTRPPLFQRIYSSFQGHLPGHWSVRPYAPRNTPQPHSLPNKGGRLTIEPLLFIANVARLYSRTVCGQGSTQHRHRHHARNIADRHTSPPNDTSNLLKSPSFRPQPHFTPAEVKSREASRPSKRFISGPRVGAVDWPSHMRQRAVHTASKCHQTPGLKRVARHLACHVASAQADIKDHESPSAVNPQTNISSSDCWQTCRQWKPFTTTSLTTSMKNTSTIARKPPFFKNR